MLKLIHLVQLDLNWIQFIHYKYIQILQESKKMLIQIVICLILADGMAQLEA